jgi:large subunit ribosomal protein L32e
MAYISSRRWRESDLLVNHKSNAEVEGEIVLVPKEYEVKHIVLLRVRTRQKGKKPHFIRQESWRYNRVGLSWRRPRGIDSKMRLKKKGRPKVVEVGYRSPKVVRGFHPSGFEERLVHNLEELEAVAKSQVVRIGHTVGSAKKLKIVEKAHELGLHVLNARGVDLDEPEESKKTSV